MSQHQHQHQQSLLCIGCDGTGNSAAFTDKRCELCKGKGVLDPNELTCIRCGHLRSSHNGDYSFTGNPTDCSVEISDDGTTCGCPGQTRDEDPFVTVAQRVTEIAEQKKRRREKLIQENKAVYDND